MKILALIPARGGSKRVPNKNIRELGGKPLIVWSIEAVRGISEVVDILVSTDSRDIAAVAVAAGASVPWLRPGKLATDTATSIDVCLHALEWYENEKECVDGLLLLQPTSPFRTTESIKQCIDLFRKQTDSTVVSFSPAESHPMWCYQISGDTVHPFIESESKPTRSQDLPSAYVINGAVYLAGPLHLRQQRSFIGKQTTPLIMSDAREALDIDTEFDWQFASILASP